MNILFLTSLKKAFLGLWYVTKTQNNFRIQICGLSVVVLMGIVIRLNLWEWIFLLASMVSVLVLEIINTAFEKLLDVIKPRLDERVGVIKDMMAAAVLLVSGGAFLVCLVIFLPRFVGILQQ